MRNYAAQTGEWLHVDETIMKHLGSLLFLQEGSHNEYRASII